MKRNFLLGFTVPLLADVCTGAKRKGRMVGLARTLALLVGLAGTLALPALGQTVLGKHPADIVTPAFMQQNGNADTLLNGLNAYSTVPFAPPGGLTLGGVTQTTWPSGGGGGGGWTNGSPSLTLQTGSYTTAGFPILNWNYHDPGGTLHTWQQTINPAGFSFGSAEVQAGNFVGSGLDLSYVLHPGDAIPYTEITGAPWIPNFAPYMSLESGNGSPVYLFMIYTNADGDRWNGSIQYSASEDFGPTFEFSDWVDAQGYTGDGSQLNGVLHPGDAPAVGNMTITSSVESAPWTNTLTIHPGINDIYAIQVNWANTPNSPALTLDPSGNLMAAGRVTAAGGTLWGSLMLTNNGFPGTVLDLRLGDASSGMPLAVYDDGTLVAGFMGDGSIVGYGGGITGVMHPGDALYGGYLQAGTVPITALNFTPLTAASGLTSASALNGANLTAGSVPLTALAVAPLTGSSLLNGANLTVGTVPMTALNFTPLTGSSALNGGNLTAGSVGIGALNFTPLTSASALNGANLTAGSVPSSALSDNLPGWGLLQTNVLNSGMHVTNANNGQVIDSTTLYQSFVTNQSFAVSGFSGLVSGRQHVISVTVSNASAMAINWTGPPTAFYFGQASASTLSIPAGKEAVISFWVWPNARTNVCNVLQQ
ncbi:MAG TPA: hypothetical protein VMU04_24655 [Candidatus Acidoferrum sp.]|nr:hypothetical protein [Candidatus Acidoferrum sp.]